MMKKRMFSLLALLTMIILLVLLFTVATACPVHAGEMPMKCHWSHQAVLGLVVMLTVTGVIKLFTSSQVSLGIGMVESLAGLYGIALMTVLIGTCQSADMHCNALFKPVGLLMFVIYIIFNALAVFRYKNKAAELDKVNHEEA